MPFLYEGRQHKRTHRESLDCAMMLEELVNMGVQNIITFDAHDPRVQNAIPLSGFDNFMPTYQFVKALFKHDQTLHIDKDNFMVISPDEGAMNRAVYPVSYTHLDVYKRQDHGKDHIPSHHNHIAVGEIKHLGNTVHHGIAQRNNRIHTAQTDAVYQIGYKTHFPLTSLCRLTL